MSNAASIVRWLSEEPHVDDGGTAFVKGLAAQLEALGLWRLSVAMITKHPEVIWRTVQVEGDQLIVRDQQPGWIDHAYYQRSPVAVARRDLTALRVPLVAGTLPYPICEDLRDKGGTDYVIHPLPFRGGQVSYISYVSKTPGGFTAEAIETLEAIRSILALRLELESSYHGTRALLDVYLGRNAGRRVFAGEFKRGQGERIEAAIWFSDLRGFTELSGKLEPEALIQILDTYFDAVATAIAHHGGEVLKFIGDAILAIFPLGDDRERVCKNALAAADEAHEAIAKVNIGREVPIRFGAALHCGEVVYGNIGASNRLDFTVISKTVNEASRLESLTKSLGVTLAMSEPFSRAAAPENLVELGAHKVKGVEEPLRVFTLERFRA